MGHEVRIPTTLGWYQSFLDALPPPRDTVGEFRVDSTAAPNDNSVVPAGDATDLTKREGQLRSVCRTEGSTETTGSVVTDTSSLCISDTAFTTHDVLS